MSAQGSVGFHWGTITGPYHANFSQVETQKFDPHWFYCLQWGCNNLFCQECNNSRPPVIMWRPPVNNWLPLDDNWRLRVNNSGHQLLCGGLQLITEAYIRHWLMRYYLDLVKIIARYEIVIARYEMIKTCYAKIITLYAILQRNNAIFITRNAIFNF